jgi:hypothetical protein
VLVALYKKYRGNKNPSSPKKKEGNDEKRRKTNRRLL